MHRKQEPKRNRGNYLKIARVGVTDLTRQKRTGTRKMINDEKRMQQKTGGERKQGKLP